jgi:hypothetical protein
MSEALGPIPSTKTNKQEQQQRKELVLELEYSSVVVFLPCTRLCLGSSPQQHTDTNTCFGFGFLMDSTVM